MVIFLPITVSSSRARICLLLPQHPACRNICSVDEPNEGDRTGLFIHFFFFLMQEDFFFKADTWHFTFLSNYFYFFTFISNFIIWIFLPLISSFLYHFSFLADSSFAAAESMMSNHWSGNALQNIQCQLIKCF